MPTKFKIPKTLGYIFAIHCLAAGIIFGSYIMWIWIAFAVTFGVYDAIMFSNRNYDKEYKFNPHTPATILRILMAIALVYSQYCSPVYFKYFWFEASLELIGLGLAFSLWHNGIYYETRRLIDKPKGYWFFGQSSTSKSKTFMLFGKPIQLFEFGVISRILQFGLALALINL